MIMSGWKGIFRQRSKGYQTCSMSFLKNECYAPFVKSPNLIPWPPWLVGSKTNTSDTKAKGFWRKYVEFQMTSVINHTFTFNRSFSALSEFQCVFIPISHLLLSLEAQRKRILRNLGISVWWQKGNWCVNHKFSYLQSWLSWKGGSKREMIERNGLREQEGEKERAVKRKMSRSDWKGQLLW